MDKKLYIKASGINEPYASNLINTNIRAAAHRIPSGAGVPKEYIALKKEMLNGLTENENPMPKKQKIVNKTPIVKDSSTMIVEHNDIIENTPIIDIEIFDGGIIATEE